MIIPILAQTAETVGEVVKVIDRASTAGDRWLFIAALVILLIFVGLVIKWLVNHIETKDARIEAKEKEHDQRLKDREAATKAERDGERTAFLTVIEGLKAEVASQTEQIRKLTDVVTVHDRDMRDVHRIETATLVHAELIRLGLDPKNFKASLG